MFDKTVRMDGSDFTENLLRYVRVDGKVLSEWESAVTVTFEGMAIRFTFATTLTADADVRITVEKGMNVQTNPDEALSKKTVQATKEFVRGENKENYFFAEGGTLNVYWATTPEAASEEDAEYIAFDLRLSVNNATYEQFDSAVLKNILIGEKDLLSILTEESGASVTLSGYTLRVKIPASYLVKGLVITVKQGFKTPAGGVLAADERFVYDEMFELFEGEVHREEIEGELKPTDVNTILTATDGVAPGTNQLFIEFTTPCSTKYLPFMQAGRGYDLRKLRVCGCDDARAVRVRADPLRNAREPVGVPVAGRKNASRMGGDGRRRRGDALHRHVLPGHELRRLLSADRDHGAKLGGDGLERGAYDHVQKRVCNARVRCV